MNSRFRQVSHRLLGPALCLCLLPSALSAQTAAKPTFQTGVSVVTLPVTVRDKKGQLVTNLTKDDFVLQEDGQPQTIKYFTLDTNLPLTLGLLVDTSMSQRNVIGEERTASEHFLDQMLNAPKDQAFLIHFDREVELLQDLTASREKLQKGLGLLDSPEPQVDDTSGGSSQGGHHAGHGGGTLLYDSIFLATDELMRKQTGRKAIIVLSDGVDRGSKETIHTAIEAAQRAETVVYTVYFKGQEGHSGGFGNNGGQPGGGWPGSRRGGYPGGGGGYPGGGGRRGGGGQNGPQEEHVDGKKILEQISGETGGRMFEVTKKQTVDQIYASIEQELRSEYVLGFTPAANGATEGFHPLQLNARKKDLYVQTRRGFYATAPTEATAAKQ